MQCQLPKPTGKDNAERKKTKSLADVRKSRQLTSILPHLTTISTEGMTQEQIDLLKSLEAEGLIPPITWIESSPNSFDEKMRYALLYLHSEQAESLGCKIIKAYDYAWIKIAMASNRMPERYRKYQYMTTPKFVKYIRSLGYTDIAGSKTINKLMAQARWLKDENKMEFYTNHINLSECKRRNLIVSKFLEIMIEI